MGIAAFGQPPPRQEVGPTFLVLHSNKDQPLLIYVNVVKLNSSKHTSVLIKQIAYLHGEPRIIWKEEQVEQMIINEDLQYAVIGKFLMNSQTLKI